MAPTPEEGGGEPAEHAAAEGVLTGEAAQVAVEDLRARGAIEMAILVAAGRLEDLGRHDLHGGED
ncbi:MAG: hypothetical protein E6J79_18185 [Deltaproteobacteria bacterium]|nr:MAG: hypothetical protein E6J79_18185 [Deltaproteobacteria bacterium]